jgi:hypothetical protein
MRTTAARLLRLLLLAPLSGLVPLSAQTPTRRPAAPVPKIEDNSFLVEEAYNQEARVVQHISALDMLTRGGDGWIYTFTQEWPLFGQTHQLSYTIPISHGDASSGTGIEDVALNYRYQLANDDRHGVAIAPRLSVLVPTGSAERGRGAGTVGLQFNVPVSLALLERLAVHWNAGATLTPSSRNALGQRATTRDFNVGQSVIWLLRPTFNLLVETVWNSSEEVVGPVQRLRGESFVISPGVRGAINLASGLQVVPGFAVPIGVGPSRGERRVFLYLSFEHPY